MRVDGLQQDGVGQDGLEEGRVNTGRAEVEIIVTPVLGPLDHRGRGELGVTWAQSQGQAATWK